MKIGILTHHWVPNFGANLQAFATVQQLIKYGHDVCVIDYRPVELVELYDHRVNESVRAVHSEFLDEFIPMTERVTGEEDIVRIVRGRAFDFVLSGSDAVLRLDPNSDRSDLQFPNPFWLTWCADARVRNWGFLSASSMGTMFGEVDGIARARIADVLESASFVSIRDRWTLRGLRQISPRINAFYTVDPVFLLSEFDVPSAHRSELITSRPYILLCLYRTTLPDSWVEQFVRRAHRHGFDVVSLPNPEGVTLNRYVDHAVKLPLHPLTWFDLIKKSAGYVGVRFHPVVCAMVNNVPFVAMDTYRRILDDSMKSKTYDLCMYMDAAPFCLGSVARKFTSAKTVFDFLQSQEFSSTVRRRDLIAYEGSKLRILLQGLKR